MTDVATSRDQIVTIIADHWRSGSVLVTGPAGSGRLAALQAAARLTRGSGKPALELIASEYTTLDDLLGRNKPIATGSQFVPGPLAMAMLEGRRLIVAEVERLSGDARQAILAALHGQTLPPLQSGFVTTLERPGFSLGATATHPDPDLTSAFASVISIA